MTNSEKRIKQGKKELMKTVKALQNKNGLLLGEEWLSDNAPLLIAAFDGYRESCSKLKKTNPERLFSLCERAAVNSLPADENSICAYFMPHRLSTDECELLIPALKANFALNAVKQRAEGTKTAEAVKLLKVLDEIDREEIFSAVSETEKILLQDPADIYRLMSPDTKAEYRRAVKKSALKKGIAEKEAAHRALKQAKTGNEPHIGFYLPFDKKQRAGWIFIASEIALTLILTVLLALQTRSTTVAFLLPVPLYSFVRTLTAVIQPKIFRTKPLFSLDSESADLYLPSAVIAVSSIIPDAKDAKGEYAHLAGLKASDSASGTLIVGLYDLKNSDKPYTSSDNANINAMKEVINRLNRDFGGGFLMAVRDRVYSPSENEFTGHERKRGAISSLVKLINRDENGFSVLHGDTYRLREKKYIFAVDSDTELSFEALRSLLCIACHPLNRPVADSAKRRITRGYGCIVPRTEASLMSSCKTLFSSLFTSGGTGAYSPLVSERYMDMFGSSLFTGKGLIDINAYCTVCLSAFDDGIILSHDIPEGALLNTCFAGNTVLTDNFPSTPGAYFRRKERWIRGDIQNLPLIFRGTSRSKASAELPAVSRFQLADNIRLALNPVFCFICLTVSLFSKDSTAVLLFTAALLGTAGEGLVTCIRTVISGGIGNLTRTFFSSSLAVGLRSLLRAFITAGMLPQNALISFTAATKALYRMCISKKHTLQWTTASASEKQKGKNAGVSYVFPLVYAVFISLFSPFAALWGITIILSLAVYFGRGIPLEKPTEKLSPPSREILQSYMSAMWDFFADNVTAEVNFLPPDNIQETPVKKTAYRTSPTNIGLYLVSVLAAADMSFITPEEAAVRINGTFDTVEALIKFKGLLYNWYDIKSLEPLKPLFVSTVDMGNLEVCLSALCQGLKEYSKVRAEFYTLAERCEKILSSFDLNILFNKKRGLFSIGLDAVSNRLSESYYDLFISEAVMTSYYHIAKRDIPVSHWGRLGRPVVKAGRYTASLSWTGTMFEYFMPTLFLPTYKNSYRWEALKVCLCQQKKFAGKNHPYGVSESGYYAFDSTLSYRYKAFGIRKLALKRNADCNRVYSPYSAFLALPLNCEDAVKNLSRFAALHALGRYGFYEAVDFSAKGNAKQDYMLVRSYMAHHVGMSIIACANALNGNIFVKRFMQNRYMMSADSLLHEKLPFDIIAPPHIYKSRERKEKPLPAVSAVPAADNTGCALYSNGEDSFICNTYGELRFLHSSLSVLGFNRRVRGIKIAVSVNGNPPVMLTGEKSKLTDTCLYGEKTVDGIIFRYALCLLTDFSALAFPVKARNNTSSKAKAEIIYYFEPDFMPASSGSEHPAFDSLCIGAKFDKTLNAVSFYQRDTKKQSCALAAGFYDGSQFMYECDRENLLNRNSVNGACFPTDCTRFGNNTQFMFPGCGINNSVEINPGKTAEKVLVISADETARGALSVFASVRRSRLPDITKASPKLSCSSELSGINPHRFACSVYFGNKDEEAAKAVEENNLPLSALWEKGISGDLPVIRVFSDNLPESAIDTVLELHRILTVTGSANDLIFITSIKEDYMNPLPPVISECLKKTADENHLGEKGGIHIVNTTDCTDGFITLLKALPGISFPGEGNGKSEEPVKPSAVIQRSLPLGNSENHFVPGGYRIGTKGKRPYCHTLSNASFGTLLTDSSLGFTWALNSRQNKLTPWNNDVSTDFDGEMLLIKHNDILYDAISGADVIYYDSKAVYTSLCGSLKVRVTLRVDAVAMKKQINVSLLGEINPKTEIIYSVIPVLAESTRLAGFVKTVDNGNFLTFTNPVNTDYGGFAAVYSDRDETVSQNGNRYSLSVNNSDVCFYTVFSRTLKGLNGLAAIPFRENDGKSLHFTAFSQSLNSFGSALLLHNIFDTRLKARTGLYQCSGARGFRDCLQDVCAIIPYYPEKTKQQIFRSCAVQFQEGDVLHWYHCVPFPKPCFKGVRTRCSDDLLWLPLAVADYIKKTKDTDILNIPVPFLTGEALGINERERYAAYGSSDVFASVYEHCIRAIKHSFRFGEHSLPLIGTGDWNDSFSSVGENMKGESVWLGMFIRLVCLEFIPICKIMKDSGNILIFAETARKLKTTIENNCFNGSCFLRGYYDNGRKLGDENSVACKIDILPQIFAVFSDTGTPEMQEKALTTAFNCLYDKKNRLLRLFSPPFGDTTEKAGYVNFYPQGVRENGGQYTHAAVWFALALLKVGKRKEATELAELLCPANRYTDGGTGEIFMNEPYAMTADICSEGALAGRGGWSLYTGSAGWYLRLLEELSQ